MDFSHGIGLFFIANSAQDKPKLSPKDLACNIASQVFINLTF